MEDLQRYGHGQSILPARGEGGGCYGAQEGAKTLTTKGKRIIYGGEEPLRGAPSEATSGNTLGNGLAHLL